MHVDMWANESGSISFHAPVPRNYHMCVFACVYFTVVIVNRLQILFFNVFNHMLVCVIASLCARLCVLCTLCTRSRARCLVGIFGGDFHIAWGHVGTVPTPGAVGAR